MEREMPRNLEAERSILGCVLLDESRLPLVLELVRKENFFHLAHRNIFDAMCRLVEKGRAIDLVTLTDELERSDQLEKSGGAAFVAQLADGLPRTVNIEHYAKIIKEKSTLRELIREGQQIIENCYSSEDDPSTIVDRAEHSIFKISEERLRRGFVPLKKLVQTSYEKVQQGQEDPTAHLGIFTGFQDFDEMTTGLQRGDMIILAARPSMGKTSLCLNIAEQVAARQGKNVGFFSLEMSAEQLALRMMCGSARVDSQKVRQRRKLSDEEWDKLAAAANKLSTLHLFIDDTPGLNVLEIRAKARRLKMEHGLDLLIIDYLQLMQGVGRTENRNQEISGISRSLKGLAKELDLPLIVLSQLSRAPETRSDHRPLLSDLRESGSLEQDADVVAFIYREELYEATPENEGLAELLVAKQRNGPTGRVELVFIKSLTRFENRAYGQDFSEPDHPFT